MSWTSDVPWTFDVQPPADGFGWDDDAVITFGSAESAGDGGFLTSGDRDEIDRAVTDLFG